MVREISWETGRRYVISIEDDQDKTFTVFDPEVEAVTGTSCGD